MTGRHALLPFLCFAPLRAGARVAVTDAARAHEDRGLLDVALVPSAPGADALVADIRNETSLAGARRAVAELPAAAPVVLLDWRSPGPWARWRRARGGRARPPFPIGGREVRREFVVEPTLDGPRHLVPPGDRGAIPAEYGAPWRRALKRAGLFFLQRRHGALVLAPGGVPGVVDEALAEVFGGPAALRRAYVSDTDAMVVAAEARGRRAFVRFPFGDRALARVRQSHRLASRLRERGFTLAPEPLRLREGGICPYQAEGAVPGSRVEPRDRAAEARAIAAALAAMAPVHRAFGRVVTVDEVAFDRHVGERLRVVEAAARRSLAAVEHRLRSALLGRRVRVTLCHGDFKLGNCLFEGERVAGIVDWDMGSEDDLELVDVGNAVGKALQDRGRLDLWQAALADAGELGRHLADVGPDPLAPPDALLLWWLDRASKQLRFGEDPDGSWTRRHVLPLLG